MPKRTAKRSKIWADYVAVMRAAEDAALAFADALERYLRKGVHAHPFRGLDAACRAANAYSVAIDRAKPYHCGVIPAWYSGHVINSSEDELISVMRELRGTAVYHRVMHVDGASTMVPRYADDGIAGFFRQELKAMEPFGSPRRTPSQTHQTT
jgi:hypothetical protein